MNQPAQPHTASGFWDERYQSEEYAFGTEPNDFLRAQAALFAPGSEVLSLAEGEGRNAVFLARRGCRVRGVDFSAEGQKKAQQLATQHGVSIAYELADLTRYDMGEARWDGIISIFCHLPQEARPALYRAIRRGLKPGGVFLIESYNRRQLEFGTGGPRDAAYLPSLEELKTAFSSFDIVLAQEIEREVQEGQYHHGLSAVTQWVGRKAG